MKTTEEDQSLGTVFMVEAPIGTGSQTGSETRTEGEGKSWTRKPFEKSVIISNVFLEADLAIVIATAVIADLGLGLEIETVNTASIGQGQDLGKRPDDIGESCINQIFEL